MIAIKVTFENGEVITTNVNATIEEVEQYYIGQYFNVGCIEDNLQKCIKVEEISK